MSLLAQVTLLQLVIIAVAVLVGWVFGRFGERAAIIRYLQGFALGAAITNPIARGDHRRFL